MTLQFDTTVKGKNINALIDDFHSAIDLKRTSKFVKFDVNFWTTTYPGMFGGTQIIWNALPANTDKRKMIELGYIPVCGMKADGTVTHKLL